MHKPTSLPVFTDSEGFYDLLRLCLSRNSPVAFRPSFDDPFVYEFKEELCKYYDNVNETREPNKKQR